jgi:hypothetical protein
MLVGKQLDTNITLLYINMALVPVLHYGTVQPICCSCWEAVVPYTALHACDPFSQDCVETVNSCLGKHYRRATMSREIQQQPKRIVILNAQDVGCPLSVKATYKPHVEKGWQ